MSMKSISEKICSSGFTLTQIAQQLGVDKSRVVRWRQSGRIPAHRVLDMERVTGIPRHELRPDIYPPEDARAEAAG